MSGSGKSTVGRAAASRLGWDFYDADDLHSPEAIDRIRRGIPLDDELRKPWLDRVRQTIREVIERDDCAVIACSALKARYRDTLSHGLQGIRFAFLSASPELLLERLSSRTGHFAGPELLDSQLAALEPPHDALWLDASQDVGTLVDQIEADVSGR